MLIAAAQTGDINRVAQANSEVIAETTALQSSLSPEYQTLVSAFFE